MDGLRAGLHAGPVDVSASAGAKLRPLAMDEVTLKGGVLGRLQDRMLGAGLTHCWEQLERSGAVENFRALARSEKNLVANLRFIDGPLYKWLEAAAWAGGRAGEATRQAAAEVVALLDSGQDGSGYLNTKIQLTRPLDRWKDLAHGHEMFFAGHLIQAAIAAGRTSGDEALVGVGMRFADCLVEAFGAPTSEAVDGHPNVEMALIELFRLTADERYLNLATGFIERRGHQRLADARVAAYFQDRVPVRDARVAEGHCVRQAYLSAAVADLYLETKDAGWLDASVRVWEDMVARHRYVTWGVGSEHQGEAYGEPYALANERAYCETCAGIGNFMWAWRLLLATGDQRYAEAMERLLWNAVMPGVSLDATRYFYVNSLLDLGEDPTYGRKTGERQAWFDVPCCPPNVARLMTSFEHYCVTTSEQAIQLQIPTPMDISARALGLDLEVRTMAPYRGDVVVTVGRAPEDDLAIQVRVPAGGSGLQVALNGEPTTFGDQDGYVSVARQWSSGDELVVSSDLRARIVVANPRVDAARGSIAVERGPLVYCIEDADHQASVLDVSTTGEVMGEEKKLIDDAEEVVALALAGRVRDAGQADLYLSQHAMEHAEARHETLTAIPYYCWGNRTRGAMRVWVPTAES